MGLLDGLTDGSGNLTPQTAGFLGLLSALGNSPGIAPQPASRLPLARPNLLSTVGAAAGGYLQGAQGAAHQNAETGLLQAQGSGANLSNLTNLQNYNLTAPYFNQPQISMKDLQKGNFDKPTMQTAAQMGASQGGAATPPSNTSPQPNLLSSVLSHISGGLLGAPAQAPGSMPVGPEAANAGAPFAGGNPQGPMADPQLTAAGYRPPQQAAQPLLGASSPAPAGLLGGPSPQSGPQGSMPQAGNPVVQRRLNQLLFGADLSPLQKIIVDQGGNPYDPQYAPMLQNEATKASGINPVIGGDRAGVPAQAYDPKTNSYSVMPGQLQAQQQGAYANAFGHSQGELPAELTKIGAQGAQSRQTAQFGANLPFEPPPTPAAAASPAQPNPMPQAQPAQYSAPLGGKTPSTVAPVSRNQDTSINMSDHSVVPSPQEASPPPDTRLDREAQIKNSRELSTKWNDSTPTLTNAEQRTLAIGDALAATQSGAWASEKADVAAKLKAVGINLPASILGDPAQVQIALKDNFQASLEQIKQFSSRPAAAELTLAQKNFSNPNLQPEANRAIIGQTIGVIRWQKSMINGWPSAQKMGWNDAQDYQRAWINHNDLNTFVKGATDSLPVFKGMAGAGQQQVSDPLGIR